MSLTERQIEIPADLREAIADVRNNATATDWCLASLSAESEALAVLLVGSGSGGAEKLRELLTQDNIYYGLVRTTETKEGELTVNVKFVFISFIGESIGVMRKAKVSTLTGDLSKAFDPFHCELKNVSSLDEVTDAAIQKEIGSMFGGVTKTKIDEDTMRIGMRTVKVTQKEDVRKKSALSERQNVSMPPELPAAIADVRDDKTPTNWCLCGFEAEGMGLQMIGSGSGGVEEMHPLLAEDNIFYGLARTTQVIEEGVPAQVRFVFISFVGEKIGVMRKAKISTLRGTIAADFDPFHVELLNVSSTAEVSEAAMHKELSMLYGGATGTVSATAADGSSTMRIGQKTVKVTAKNEDRKKSAINEAQKVNLPDGLAPAIADVRNDATPTNWCLCSFEAGGLQMTGSGSGGAAELAAQLKDESIFFGFIRTTETIDASVTVKFVYVSFIGDHVPPMRKAKISTLKGSITEAFSPFHAELLNASSQDEVTDAAVVALLKKADGATGTAQATAKRFAEQKVVVTKAQHGFEGIPKSS